MENEELNLVVGQWVRYYDNNYGWREVPDGTPGYITYVHVDDGYSVCFPTRPEVGVIEGEIEAVPFTEELWEEWMICRMKG